MPNKRVKWGHYQNLPLNIDRTPSNMYLWGFLWSDGYIKPPQRVTLEIVTQDFNDIRDTIPDIFGIYPRQRKNRQHQTAAIASRTDLVNWLHRHGYADKQQPSEWLTCHKLSYYWYRGVVDGDGCWYWNPKWKTRQFVLASHFNQEWSFFTDLLDDLGCRYVIKRRQQRKNTQHYSIVRMCGKNSLRALYEYLYPCGCDIGLQRKYVKAKLCI